MKFVPNGPFDNKHALGYIMTWRWLGNKPLSEPVMAKFADVYIRHSVSISFNKLMAVELFGITVASRESWKTAMLHITDPW